MAISALAILGFFGLMLTIAVGGDAQMGSL